MPKPPLATVDAYIAAQTPGSQAALEKLRATIRRLLPDADESISYGMPTWKRDGTPVVYLAGWKQHVSLYYASRRVIEGLGDALTPYLVEKGTIRFDNGTPLPMKLVERIIRLRAEDAAEDAMVKAARKQAAKPKKAAVKKPAAKRSVAKKPAIAKTKKRPSTKTARRAR